MKIPAKIFFLLIWFWRWKCFGERARLGRSLTRLAANTKAMERGKVFGAGRTERQPGRLRSSITASTSLYLIRLNVKGVNPAK
jgi:hypothetical protein